MKNKDKGEDLPNEEQELVPKVVYKKNTFLNREVRTIVMVPKEPEVELVKHVITEEDVAANPDADLKLGEKVEIPVDVEQELKAEDKKEEAKPDKKKDKKK